MEKIVEFLKRNKNGQYDDERYSEIKSDIEKSMSEIFDKWDNIIPSDIENIMSHTIAWMGCQQSLKNSSKDNFLSVD